MGYLGFGKLLPQAILDETVDGERGCLVSRVLPMGFLNSLAIALHIHRNVVWKCMGSLRPPIGGESEIGRDRVTSSHSLFRVYLDNFDQLSKVDRKTAELISGEPSEMVESLRGAYKDAGLPAPKASEEGNSTGSWGGSSRCLGRWRAGTGLCEALEGGQVCCPGLSTIGHWAL